MTREETTQSSVLSPQPSLAADVRAAWRLPYPTTPHDIWTRTNVGEVFPNVITPLSWSVYYGSLAQRLLGDPSRLALVPPDLFEDGRPPLVFTTINGRLWYNAGLMHYIATERFGLPSWFYSLSLGGPREGERLNLPAHGWRPLRLLRALPGILGEQRRLQQVVKEFLRDAPAMRGETRRLRAEDLSGLDGPALLARLDRIIDSATAPYIQLLDGSALALNAYGTLAWLSEQWCGDRTLANDLVTGLANLLTAQASISLWAVARAARKSPAARRIIATAPPAELRQRLEAEPEAKPVAVALDRFFAEHGHRAVDEFELSVPRWSEDPSLVVATLRTYLDAPAEMDPSRHLARQRSRRATAERKARRRLLRRPLDRLAPWRWVVFRSTIGNARRYLPMRENPKYHFLLYASELRRTILTLGETLHRAGAIESPEDIFFLMRPEIERSVRGETADLRPAVGAQRRLYERFRAWEPPEVIHGEEREAVEMALDGAVPAPSAEPKAPERPASAAGRLTGIAASAGVATGRARVALTPEEGAAIEPGEILVAPFTDPGWTPLFTVAGAIVLDLGGLLSHGAIVAREYGIPAVVNTRTATATLTTGQVVTVNGSTGEVTWQPSTDGPGGM
ncbi:MAG: PEP-utilizing enzyme [Dehalococcoidia bacterium]